jgi:hypothetical protein
MVIGTKFICYFRKITSILTKYFTFRMKANQIEERKLIKSCSFGSLIGTYRVF